MKVITISGKAQNGKDTTAGLLKAALEADGYKVLITHYADLLKYICKQFFGWGQDRKMMLVGIFFNMSEQTSFGRNALTIGRVCYINFGAIPK